MAKLTQTQAKLLQLAARRGKVHFQTSLETRRRFGPLYVVGGRDLKAAEALAALGLMIEVGRKGDSTLVRSSMGYRKVSWVDHDFAITEAGRAALAALEAA